MQGVILAAGKGTRLHPLTLHRSKAMMPIVGKPIVERVMDMLVHNSIHDIVLVVSPDDQAIRHHFEQVSRIDAQVRFVDQVERQGMAKALELAAPMLTQDFVLSACDNLVTQAAVGDLIRTLQSEDTPNAVLTLMPVTRDKIASTGIVDMRGKWITRIVEKPTPEEAPSNMSSLPLYAFAHKLLRYLPKVQPSPRGEYELQDAIQMLIAEEGKVTGVEVQSRMTLTRPDDLLTLNRTYLGYGEHREYTGNQEIIATAPVCVAQNAKIGRNCSLGPNVYIAEDCIIGEGSTLRDVVVMPGAVVPGGSVIEHQVIPGA